jgi:dolichol-phosphate mannosyltransferase
MKLMRILSRGTRIGDKWASLFKFALVGGTGAAVNLSILWFLTSYGILCYVSSAFIAIEASIFWNFFLNSRITFKYKYLNKYNLSLAILKYHLASALGTLVNISALIILTEYFNIYYIISEAMAIFLAFCLNYLISINLVWNKHH